jgi:hypothetical protein
MAALRDKNLGRQFGLIEDYNMLCIIKCRSVTWQRGRQALLSHLTINKTSQPQLKILRLENLRMDICSAAGLS